MLPPQLALRFVHGDLLVWGGDVCRAGSIPRPAPSPMPRHRQRMISLTTTLFLAIALFVASNIDDLFILLVFFADARFRPMHIVLGQFGGMGALVLFSWLAALVALVIPPVYVGLLGLVPIAIGLKQLLDLWRGKSNDDDDAELAARAGARGPVLTVAAVTIANGGDNIGVYVPVFATRSADDVTLIVVVFALMTVAWCAIAHWLVNHRTIGAPIRRYGAPLLPWVLIGVGVLVLVESGTLTLLR
jgi:cadmium resistance protein CadD (predicted permease)